MFLDGTIYALARLIDVAALHNDLIPFVEQWRRGRPSRSDVSQIRQVGSQILFIIHSNGISVVPTNISAKFSLVITVAQRYIIDSVV